jgi:hypothetical protein
MSLLAASAETVRAGRPAVPLGARAHCHKCPDFETVSHARRAGRGDFHTWPSPTMPTRSFMGGWRGQSRAFSNFAVYGKRQDELAGES